MQRQIAQAVKDYLVKLAVDDKLPLDMNGLETGDIEDVVAEAITKFEHDNPTVAGFSHEDIMDQAEQDGIELTEDEAKEVVRWMIMKAEIPIGWDTVSYYISEFKK